jgi:hypothetical protein
MSEDSPKRLSSIADRRRKTDATEHPSCARPGSGADSELAAQLGGSPAGAPGRAQALHDAKWRPAAGVRASCSSSSTDQWSLA